MTGPVRRRGQGHVSKIGVEVEGRVLDHLVWRDAGVQTGEVAKLVEEVGGVLRANSVPRMLATTATKPLAVATVVGSMRQAAVGCRPRLNVRKATSQERRVNSSQLWMP